MFIVCEILTAAPVDTHFGADWSVAAAVVGLPVLVLVVGGTCWIANIVQRLGGGAAPAPPLLGGGPV